MSNGKENPLTVKARNAKPERSALRSAQGNLHQKMHPEQAHENRRKREEKIGHPQQGYYAEMIETARDPITFESDNVVLACDFHIPFHDEDLIKEMFAAAKEHGCKVLAIDGDLLDCDNVSKFNSITESEQEDRITFKGECEEAKKMFKRLLQVFDDIYICQGNHEKRWSDLNAGKVGMKQLIALCRPSNMSEDAFNARVHVTLDDHMILNHNGEKWLLCHPRNFRITPLSVARDLAAKFMMNVHMAHGHGFNQGRDRSGKFICLDGGGLYERAALEYTRQTTCHPMTRSGFYVLKQGKVIPYEGKA